MRKELPPVDELRQLFFYCPESGKLIRKITTSSNSKAGSEIKSFCKKGYRRVRLHGNNCYAHRVCWKIYYEEDPPLFIDHVNRNKGDNRISNLRKADASLNGVNRKLQKNNKSGFTGIKKQCGKWAVTIAKNKKN